MAQTAALSLASMEAAMSLARSMDMAEAAAAAAASLEAATLSLFITKAAAASLEAATLSLFITKAAGPPASLRFDASAEHSAADRLDMDAKDSAADPAPDTKEEAKEWGSPILARAAGVGPAPAPCSAARGMMGAGLMGTWREGPSESCLRSGRSAVENLEARDPESAESEEARDTGSSIP